jgi:threonine dehydratase
LPFAVAFAFCCRLCLLLSPLLFVVILSAAKDLRFLRYKETLPITKPLIIGICGGTGAGKTTITRRIIEALVDDILLAEEDAIERAVALLLEEQRLVVEGTGAAPLAALIAHKRRFRGKRVGLIVSGGNIDARLLASILQRALARAGRLARLRIEITDVPGAMAKVTAIIAKFGGNIVEIYHQRLFPDVPVKLADVDVVVETRNAAHVGEIVAGLTAAGLPARVLTSTGHADED